MNSDHPSSHSNTAPQTEPMGDRHPDTPTTPGVVSALVGRRLPHSRWGFWIPLTIQALFIALAPAQALYTMAVGTPVVLQTMPVDPYSLFRGYYVTLSYDISSVAELESLPGSEDTLAQIQADFAQRTSTFDRAIDLYVVVEAPENAATNPPTPWTPVAVTRDRPTDLPANQVALHGIYRSGRITYDLERYYIPEEQRDTINEQIARIQRETATDEQQPFVVEVRVGAQGNAVPVGFWLEDAFFRF